MRKVTKIEARGRGCRICAHHCKKVGNTKENRELRKKLGAKKSERMIFCPFDKCPYTELDGLKDYLLQYDKPMAHRMRKLKLFDEKE